jgi:hypothetical protein
MNIKGVGFTKHANTGKASVTYDPSPIRGGFLAPVANSIITPANQTGPALQAFIQAQLTHDDPKMRWQQIGPFEQMDDKSEAPQKQTLGYGRSFITDRGKIGLEFTYLEGGFDYHMSILNYNGAQSQYKWFEYDSTTNLIAAQALDASGNMKGISLSQIFAYDVKEANRTTVPEYRLALMFLTNAERNENRFVLKTGFDFISAFEGIGVQDVVLQNVTPVGTAAGTYHIAATVGGGAIDLVNTLQSTLAVTAAQAITNAQTGAAITITSVALNGTKTAMVIVLDKTDTDYPAVAAGSYVSFGLALVSVLAGLNMKYYEATPLLVLAT